jgi:hypothetical protein
MSEIRFLVEMSHPRLSVTEIDSGSKNKFAMNFTTINMSST